MIISLKKVCKHYVDGTRVNTALNDVSFSADAGEFIIVSGASGSGKSTLLNILSGTDYITGGVYFFDGRDTDEFDESDWETIRRDKFGIVYQDSRIIDEYTVRENIELALSLCYSDKKTIRLKADNLMLQTGIADCSCKKAKYLSGGQKQRVAIARALANKPKVIIADEPTANLDENTAGEIIQLLKDISKGRLVIVVTHNIELFFSVATRQIVLNDGQIERDSILSAADDEQLKNEELNKEINQKNRRIYCLFKHNKNGLAIFWVLLFVQLFLLTVYSAVLNNFTGNSVNLSSTLYFNYLDSRRYIVSKNDGTFFTDSDYQEISQKFPDSKIIKEDPAIDCIAKTYSKSKHAYMNVNVLPISLLDESSLKNGKPQNDSNVIWQNDIGNPVYGFENPSESHVLELDGGTKLNIEVTDFIKGNKDGLINVFYVSDKYFSIIYYNKLANSSKIFLNIGGYQSEVSHIILSDEIEKGKILLIGEKDEITSDAIIKIENIHGLYSTEAMTIINSGAMPDLYDVYREENGAAVVSCDDLEEMLSNQYYQISVFLESKLSSWGNYNVFYPYAINSDMKGSNYKLGVLIFLLFLTAITCIISLIAYLFFRRKAKSELSILYVRKLIGEPQKNLYLLIYLRCIIPGILSGIITFIVVSLMHLLAVRAADFDYSLPFGNIPYWQTLMICLIMCIGISLPLALYELKKLNLIDARKIK